MLISDTYLLNNLSHDDMSISQAMDRLSSSKRINSAADDPADMSRLSYYKKTTSEFETGNSNIDSGNSLLGTADGAAAQLASILTNMKDLATKAQDTTYSASDLAGFDTQYQNYLSQYDNIVSSTKFNGFSLLDSANSFNVYAGGGISISLSTFDVSSTNANINTSGTSVADATSAQNAATVLNSAIDYLNNTVRSSFGSQMQQLGIQQNYNANMITTFDNARSRIEDANTALETSNLSKAQMLHNTNIDLLHTYSTLQSSFIKLLDS